MISIRVSQRNRDKCLNHANMTGLNEMEGRLRVATQTGILQTVAILLLTMGANYIEQNDYMVGGALATIGFILLVVSNYVSFR